MEYLSVKNLHKYQHYKDRNITTWIKVICNIIDDPDMVSLDDIDRWRWVGLLILATKNANRIPQDSVWVESRISCGNLRPMHKTISKFKRLGWLVVYQDSRQPLDNVYRKGLDGIGLDGIKEKDTPTPAQAALKEIEQSGFNIYQCLNALKKNKGWKKDENLPEEVILKVCGQYWKQKEKIVNPFPWFLTVVNSEVRAWGADQSMAQAKELKDLDIAPFMKELINGLAQKKAVSL